MKCKKCGFDNKPGVKFCEDCGAPVDGSEEREEKKPKDKDKEREKARRTPESVKEPVKKKTPSVKGKKITDNVMLCTDGKYRWVYEMNLYKNPTVFILVWKILFFICLAIFVVMNVADAINNGDYFPGRFLSNLKISVYVLLGMTVLTAVGCFVHAKINGGKYCVVFEMDEKGVNHKQMPATAEKSELISQISVLAGLASVDPMKVGIGMAAARTEMYTGFSKVRKVIACPRRQLIKVNGLFSRNQVYTAKKDYGFVCGYIMEKIGK